MKTKLYFSPLFIIIVLAGFSLSTFQLVYSSTGDTPAPTTPAPDTSTAPSTPTPPPTDTTTATAPSTPSTTTTQPAADTTTATLPSTPAPVTSATPSTPPTTDTTTAATPSTPPTTDTTGSSTPASAAPTGPANPETVKVKRVKKLRRPGKTTRKLRRIRSMADIPESEEEQRLIAHEVSRPQEAGVALSSQAPVEPTQVALPKLTDVANVYLGEYMQPWKGLPPEEITLTLGTDKEGADLRELLNILSQYLHVSFITDDSIQPTLAEGLTPVGGTKINFKSNTPLSLKQLWETGITFIEMAGFSITPTTQPRTYHITATKTASKDPLPTFIGTDPDLLPNSDVKVRYVYFVENIDLKTAQEIVQAMQSSSAGPLIPIAQLRALIMTDKAANIKSILQILQELDQVTMPETLAIIRLRHTDAQKISDLYNQLIGQTEQAAFNPFAPQRKPTTTKYFTPATRVFPEPRTNSLIVLGTRDNIKKFEEFIFNYIDKTLDLPFSPLHILQLKYISAEDVARILEDVIKRFNADPANAQAALYGGVREGNKFFKPTMRITPEPFSNRVIINADYEEYLKLREIIEKLDVEQPQVAIKVLILNVDLTNVNELGTQIRNSLDCCDRTGGTDSLLGPNVNFQTSTLGPIQTLDDINGQPVNGSLRLLGNLINLVRPGTTGIGLFPAGSTLVTLGRDIFGFWGLLRVLQTYARVSVIANPFLVTTHKYKAEIKIGETRRVISAIVEGIRPAEANDDLSADLRVVITPQISYDDMVTLNIYVELGQFIDATTADRLIKKVSTEALVANREVVALGGLIRDRVIETEAGIPLLKDIPLLGWLFKNKRKDILRSSLLILISPEIIKPHEPEVAQQFTYEKVNAAKRTLYRMQNPTEERDPLHRWIFRDHIDKDAATIDKFISMQQRYVDETRKNVAPVVALKEDNKATNTTKQKLRKKGLLDLVKPSKAQQRGVAA